MTVSFDIGYQDRLLLRRIIMPRAGRLVESAGRALSDDGRLALEMDLVAAHANGNLMDFARLAVADDFGFAHDVFGIDRHLNRRTGKLMDCFVPRFAAHAKSGHRRSA